MEFCRLPSQAFAGGQPHLPAIHVYMYVIGAAFIHQPHQASMTHNVPLQHSIGHEFSCWCWTERMSLLVFD